MSAEPVKVLLVEDNQGDARLLHESLSEALPGQFQVAHAQRLSDALEWLWQETCDLVLLDLGLPDSHGLDTLTLLRAQVPAVPVVVLTGFEDEATAIEAIQKGAQDYLIKGQVDGRLLGRSLRYAMERKRREEALAGQAVAVARVEDLLRSRQRIMAAQEAVRREIAYRLKEGVEARLLDLEGRLEELARDTSLSSETAVLLRVLIQGIVQAIRPEVVGACHQLYPLLLRQGLGPALQHLGIASVGTLSVEVEIDEKFTQMEKDNRELVPKEVALVTYRIAEEAMTNAVKHAKASRVAIRLDLVWDGGLCLTVQDNGCNFVVERSDGGLGIRTIRDYAEAIGGACVIQSAEAGGIEITAKFPLAGPGASVPKIAEVQG